MNTCKNCDGPLLELFFSKVCKNDCTKNQSINQTKIPQPPYQHLQTWISPSQKRTIIMYLREDKRPLSWIKALRSPSDVNRPLDEYFWDNGADLAAWTKVAATDPGGKFIVDGIWSSKFHGWVAFLI